jgi:hypothetical protein
MDRDKFKKLLRSHLEAEEPECRWCFAIDMQRVKGKIVAQYNFPDGMVLHLSCSRCGGDFSFYTEGWSEDYLKNVIFKLHPELENNVSDELFKEINDRVLPEYLDT